MTADDGCPYASYISQGRDGPVYGSPQDMADGSHAVLKFYLCVAADVRDSTVKAEPALGNSRGG